MIRAAVIVALLSMLAAPAQQAPQKAPAPTTEGAVKFQANTQLVVETVTVTDKNGKPVEGLTARDFTVTEDGVPQAISFCEFQKLAEEPEGAAPAPKPASAAAAADQSKAAPVVQFQIAPERPGDVRYRDRRLIALYFDMSAMPPPDQYRAQTAAQKFLARQMTSADLVAVMSFSDRLHVLQDFTDDRAQLARVIDKLFIGESLGFDPTDSDDSTSDYGSAFGEDDAEFNIFNTDRQLAALETAVKTLGQLNEKKVLVYFASGLRLNGVDNQAQLQATTNAAVRSNVAFYTVDARGLVAQAPMGDATKGSPGGLGMYSGASALAFANNFQKSQDTLFALAKDTGGKALLDKNDLSEGVVQAQRAISSYYIIGYYSANSTLDGRFRRIKITYPGDLAAKLDYRQGYYAGKVFAKFTALDRERQLHDALMLEDPITELTIQMEIAYFQLNSAEYFVPEAVKIPGRELALARRRGADHTLIDFIGEVKDNHGSTMQNVRDKVDIKLTGATAAELAKRPIEYPSGFTLLPGKYQIKFLARDAETGRIGTYHANFVIPNLNKEQQRIPISSVVLSSQKVPLKEALYNALKQKDRAETSNPLVEQGEKLIPSVTRVFSKSRNMYVYLQAYEPGVTQTQPLLSVVTLYNGSAKAFETAPLEVKDGWSNRLRTMPMSYTLSLDKLPPGRYTCQVTILDPGSQKAAFWQAPIMLVP